jgi:predicted DNA-binding transcriptional regulator YafY
MAVNKLALMRYKTIDTCLRNRFRKWSLEDIIQAVSDALYDLEGIHTGVSKRTIQMDLQTMRSDKLGYNAPIIITDKKFYSYEDKDYSITNSKVSAQDIAKLSDVITLLKQFKGFTYFEDISEMVGKIEHKIHKQSPTARTYIDVEKNELLKGLELIEPLLDAVKNEYTIDILYQSFKAKEAQIITVYPYLLKEYRNRWFLLCKNTARQDVMILALDRMQSFTINKKIAFHLPKDFDIETFFDDCLGVTKQLGQRVSNVVLKIDNKNAPYIFTKPIHRSQTIINTEEHYTIFSIQVLLNFELEREILGFGENIEVLSPRILRAKIAKRIGRCNEMYVLGKME